METSILYASAHSLYSGRARSYLIKAGVPFEEQIPKTQHYREVVLPRAGGRQGVPTLELSDGGVIRDGAAIIDHFEAASGHGFSPVTPKHRMLSLLFDVMGAEGLLRPAMHYRWNFDDDNFAFLRTQFQMFTPPGMEAMAEKMMGNMRQACMAFGAVPDTFALVESLYEALLDRLQAHFAVHPYLLGGKPCIGDFGMIAPLYAHLGRDPKPLAMMQAKSPALFRWVERMNRADSDMGEFTETPATYLADDEVPDTLVEVLRQLAIDFVPETRAAAACINDWLAEQAELEPGTEVVRGVGLGTFTVEGTTVNALAQPYRFYLLKRVQDAFAELDAGEQADVRALLTTCGLEDVLGITINRGIGRAGNLEVRT